MIGPVPEQMRGILETVFISIKTMKYRRRLPQRITTRTWYYEIQSCRYGLQRFDHDVINEQR
jgi:hypothetical protein